MYETEQIRRVSVRSSSLANPQRHDGPHSITARFWQFIEEEDTGSEGAIQPMSWRSQLAWWCDPRQWLRAILRLKDTPHSIALGTAVGVFVGLTPTFGIQMLLVLAIAFLARPVFRFNQIAALVAVYISNPFTMVPIYWCNYKIGSLFLETSLTWEEFRELFHYSGVSSWWTTVQGVFVTIGAPLIIGSLIVASAFALPTYPLMKRLLERVQARRARRRERRQEKMMLAEQTNSDEVKPGSPIKVSTAINEKLSPHDRSVASQ